MQRFLQHQASWGRHTFALNQEITSASKAWEHPAQIKLLCPPETWSHSTETLVTRWQTSCFLGHVCQAVPSHIMDSPKKKDTNKYKVILRLVVFRLCVICQHPYPVELLLKRGTWPKMLSPGIMPAAGTKHQLQDNHQESNHDVALWMCCTL